MARALTRTGVVALTAFMATGLVACGGGDDDQAAAPAAASSGGTRPVTAGVIPVTDAGPIVMGQKQGVWTDDGLDLTVKTANSSPNIISAVMSGDYQIGYGGVTAVFQAVENGIDLTLIAPASATADDPNNGINDILVLPNSKLQSAKDLEGKKVAVNALGGYVQLLADIAIDAQGGDPSKVQWVELPIPDQPAALESGAIDAFVAGEPFGTLGREKGFRTLANPHALLSDKAVVAGVWYASRKAVEKDPEYYKQVAKAINDSNALALKDDAGLRNTIAEFTKIDPSLAAKIRLGSYGKLPLTAENMQPLADASLKFGLVKKKVDLDKLIWKP
ncbi:ABC transporter substrate-binding protein [Modestobacter sp. NPDC049651]|uniref:ABC transporter substrate-binding protein n=1 Tax=unclassified Modestobacter TaxID=2643866 RepID=UPI0033EDA497